jgi:uncharacterized protein (TIGR03118 family)
MEMGFERTRWRQAATALVVASLTAVLVAIAGAASLQAGEEVGNVYTVHNLVSDVPGLADKVDPNLVNGWGLTRTATSPWWVADNHTNVSTLYRGDGTIVPLVVQVPGGPTGAVANPGTHFVVTSGGASGAARFLFDNEDGQILGWNPNVPAAGSTQAVVAVTTPGAIYKGLTLASTPAGDFLYAADFHNAKVDVFDGNFQPANLPAGAFTDPKLPDGFAPFGIQNVEGRIFVTYARQDEEAEDEVAGVNQGFVDVFDTSGTLLGHVGTRAFLNAPWGVARAPAGFGKFSGDLLVGNFGDGRIAAYKAHGACAFGLDAPSAGTSAVHPCFTPEGVLRRADGSPVSIDGLWGIGFGGGPLTGSGPATTLFFAAGPDDEEHGLFGTVTAA